MENELKRAVVVTITGTGPEVYMGEAAAAIHAEFASVHPPIAPSRQKTRSSSSQSKVLGVERSPGSVLLPRFSVLLRPCLVTRARHHPWPCPMCGAAGLSIWCLGVLALSGRWQPTGRRYYIVLAIGHHIPDQGGHDLGFRLIQSLSSCSLSSCSLRLGLTSKKL